MKTLVIKFKYLGDIVTMTPSLRALHAQDPTGELHVLVAAEAAPLLENLPWITHVWAVPRVRGKVRLSESLPLIRRLRAMHFDRSVDFVGNDRGAIWSLLIGAGRRLGMQGPLGFWGRRYCYHDLAPVPSYGRNETEREFDVLAPWNVPAPASFSPGIKADSALVSSLRHLIPHGAIICHLSTSQPKKEWPLEHWSRLIDLCPRLPFVFSTGPSPREQLLIDSLRARHPGISVLPTQPGLSGFLALLASATLVIAGDTGPLHFAAAVGVPTLSLFGPSSPVQWAPVGPTHRTLTGSSCPCSVHAAACTSATPCIAAITPEQVASQIRDFLSAHPV